MYLIVALGNIGRQYEMTRHNFGFLLLDRLIDDYCFMSQSKKFKSEVFSGQIANQKIIALKPQTFMNLSGDAVLQAASFYKIKPSNILVLHDDIDFALGKIKFKIGGGNGGHNGLKSIDEMIGKNYMRLRLGVGRPQNKNYETADYVLSKFSSDEMAIVNEVNDKISNLFDKILTSDIDGFLNDFAQKSIL